MPLCSPSLTLPPLEGEDPNPPSTHTRRRVRLALPPQGRPRCPAFRIPCSLESRRSQCVASDSVLPTWRFVPPSSTAKRSPAERTVVVVSSLRLPALRRQTTACSRSSRRHPWRWGCRDHRHPPRDSHVRQARPSIGPCLRLPSPCFRSLPPIRRPWDLCPRAVRP